MTLSKLKAENIKTLNYKIPSDISSSAFLWFLLFYQKFKTYYKKCEYKFFKNE